MRKIRFGIIGCGSIARKAFLPALRLSEHAELKLIATRSNKKARELSAEFNVECIVGYGDIFKRDDIDAVYIAAPTGMHCKLAVESARCGKHILCEKSLACRLKEVNEIVSECAKNNVALLEGFMYQFHSQHSLVRELIMAGDIGRPAHFNAWFGFPPLNKGNIRYDDKLGGSALLDAGSYCVHSARRFFGCEPSVCGASLFKGRHRVDIKGSALLYFNKGLTATVVFGFDNYYRNTYSVWGSGGVVTLTRAFSLPADFAPEIIIERKNRRMVKRAKPCNQFLAEIEHFSKNVNNENMRYAWRKDALSQASVLEFIRQKNEDNSSI